MKILVTSFTFPPEASGVSEIARAQACGLADRGHEVTVATAHHPGRTEEHAFGRLRVEQFKIRGVYDSRSGYEGEIEAYQELVAKGGFDVILCNCWQSWATDLAVAAFPRTAAKKVIVSQGLDAHLWHPYPRFPWGLPTWGRGWRYVFGLRRAMASFDQLIFLSQRRDLGRFFDHWLARHWGLRHVSIIPNGIHLADLRRPGIDFRATYGISTPRLVLNVANYCDRKNQRATLQAFLRARRADATLVFIGSELNEYAQGLRRLYQAAGAGAGQVLFLERVPKAHINAAYQAADLFMLSAKAETQPLVLLDAMAAGVPFISTDTGCVSELVGGQVVKGEAATARAIHQLLDDPDLHRRLAEQGRAEAESKYSWAQVISECEALFLRLGAGR